MPRFLIDVDEVLTPFTERFISIVSGMLGREWDPRKELANEEWDLFSALLPGQRDAAHAVLERPGYCLEAPVAEGSQKFVQDLRDLGFDVLAVTSPLKGPHWALERELWLAKHFDIQRSHIHSTSDKAGVEGDFFLDDHPKHVVNWAARWPKGVPMLWTTEFNRGRLKGPSDEYRVDGWENVLEKVRAFKKEA